MKKIFYVLLGVFAIGCTNISYNQLSADIDVNVAANLEASITVGDKISGQGSETVILFFFKLPGTRYRAQGSAVALNSSSPSKHVLFNLFSSINPFNVIENAKGEAVYDAITSTNSDLIINPKFLITEQDFFFYKTVQCEVTGRKGTVKTIK